MINKNYMRLCRAFIKQLVSDSRNAYYRDEIVSFLKSKYSDLFFDLGEIDKSAFLESL